MLGVQFTHRLPLSSTTFPHLPRVPLSNTTRTSPITFCEQIIIVVRPLAFFRPTSSLWLGPAPTSTITTTMAGVAS